MRNFTDFEQNMLLFMFAVFVVLLVLDVVNTIKKEL